MKTAYELLETCPDGQEVRMRLVFSDVAAGRWQDAAHHLRNAIRETKESAADWANDARHLCRYCESSITRGRVADHMMRA